MFELSSSALEIPNDVHTTISQKLDWMFNTQSRVLQPDWLILDNNEEGNFGH